MFYKFKAPIVVILHRTENPSDHGERERRKSDNEQFLSERNEMERVYCERIFSSDRANPKGGFPGCPFFGSVSLGKQRNDQ